MNPTLAVLRGRDFRRFFAAQAVSLLGDGMTSVALAFAVLDLTGSAADLGAVLAVRAAPLVLLLLVGGVFADRLSRRRVMVAADLVRLASQGTLAALLVTGHARMGQVLVLTAVHGAASAFFNPASTGILPEIVHPDHLQPANSLRGLSMAAGSIAGPAVAGAVVALAGSGWAIAADAATFGISAAFLWGVRPTAGGRAAWGSVARDLREGFAAVRSRTWVWTIIAAAAVVNTMVGWFTVLGAVVARRSLGGAGAWAAVLAALAAGAFLGGLVALRVRPRRPLVVGCVGLFLLAAPPAAMASGLPVVVVAATAVLAGAASMLFNALWETSLQRHVPRAVLSRVSAYDWLGSTALYPLGLAVSGWVAGAVGVNSALWLATAIAAVSSLVPMLSVSVRTLGADAPLAGPSHPAPAAAHMREPQ